MQERKNPIRRSAGARDQKVNAPTGRGRSLGKVNRKSSPPAIPAPRTPVAAPEIHTCPECGKQFRTDAAVQTHRHAAHGTAAMIVGDMTRCAECGSLVRNSNMDRHYSLKHGMR